MSFDPNFVPTQYVETETNLPYVPTGEDLANEEPADEEPAEEGE